MSYIPVNNLNKKERDRTPLYFARYLVNRLHQFMGQESVVAALWCSEDSHYRELKGVEVWGIQENALRYAGPWPIIAHPPCGPWGMLRHLSFEEDDHGIRAMELVHQYGGVVEQPSGSQLFKQYAIRPFVTHAPGSEIQVEAGVPHVEVLNQGDYGHRARKRTLLYWYKPPSILSWVPAARLRRRPPP